MFFNFLFEIRTRNLSFFYEFQTGKTTFPQELEETYWREEEPAERASQCRRGGRTSFRSALDGSVAKLSLK